MTLRNIFQRMFILCLCIEVTINIVYYGYPHLAMGRFSLPIGRSSSESGNRISGKTEHKELSTAAAAPTENPIKSSTSAIALSGTSVFVFPVDNNSVRNITAQNMTKLNGSGNTPLLIGKLMQNITYLAEGGDAKRKEPVLPPCEIPPDLGPITANKTEVYLVDVEKKYPEVQWGGRYSPRDCAARDRVAIIVPFRDRMQCLAIFLNHMHPFLMRQKIEYGIFIVDQADKSPFNRGKLMNVGYVESQKQKAGGWHCFIFHDVDLLPLDERNMYSCPRQPRHMSASVDKLKFMLPYEEIFGGVSAMTDVHFEAVNGFPNKYWGWGGEDDDMSYRIRKMGFHLTRYKFSVARYTMLDHNATWRNPRRTTHSRSFGGVAAMTKEQFEAVNGFSNKYWGWGGEDNDMFYRIQKKGFRIRKYDRFSSRYAMLDHEKTSPNPRRFDLLKEATKGGRLYHDGLSDLDYAVKKIVKYRLHTHILVNLHYAAQAQLRTTPRSCPTSKGGNATHCAAPQTAHAATHSGLKSNRST